MRKIMMTAALLLAAVSATQAYAGNKYPDPGTVVALYECEHVDTSIAHFTCSFSKGEFHIVWQDDVTKMPTEERRRAMYEVSKLGLHIIQYGNSYTVTSKAHPGKVYECQRAQTGYIATTCN